MVTLYHGSDVPSILRFLFGGALDTQEARSRKIDGPFGFYLATDRGDAEFFAGRRSPGAIMEVDLTEDAMTSLRQAGAVLQPIPVTRSSPYFSGDELWIPESAFDLFNILLRKGDINVRA